MTGGVFTVTIWHADKEAVVDGGEVKTQEIILWDRKRDGGFPGMLLYITCILILFQAYTYVLLNSKASVLTDFSLEVKALKSLVRNVIAPERDLGHTDRALKQQAEKKEVKEEEKKEEQAGEMKEKCEDCV
jgi:predicted Rdx family selenoprotein